MIAKAISWCKKMGVSNKIRLPNVWLYWTDSLRSLTGRVREGGGAVAATSGQIMSIALSFLHDLIRVGQSAVGPQGPYRCRIGFPGAPIMRINTPPACMEIVSKTTATRSSDGALLSDMSHQIESHFDMLLQTLHQM